MTKFGISLETFILAALAGRSPMATYVIRNTLDRPGGRFHRQGLKTSHVLSACRRLEKLGEIEPAPTTYMVMKVWQITDRGRETVAICDLNGQSTP